MNVIVKPTWETVFFTAIKSGFEITVELSLNRESGVFTISQKNQEGIRFDGDSIEEAEMRVKAQAAAVRYVKSVLTASH
jgi:hypothetical protein